MKCFLHCVNNSHSPIPLPDGCPVHIGRNPLSKITDKRCSRQQLELIADYKTKQVTINQKGNNSSAIGSTELSQGEIITVSDGTIVNVLTDLYPHQIKFSDSASSKIKTNRNLEINSSSKKRKSTDTNEDSEKNIKKVKRERSTENNCVQDTEEKDLQSVAEKLDRLKQAAKCETNLSASEKRCEGSGLFGEPCKESSWSKTGKLLAYISKGVQARNKVAAFDIDGTIIGTLSGKVFPTHSGDWKILYGEISSKLKRLYNDGYKIVFVTNQLGIERGKTKESDLKTKFTGVIERIGIPVQVLISTGSGIYRKPATGMWKYLINEGNDGVPISVRESFYVGDAAGRPEKWSPGKKKDFSCSDRLFAMNIGLKFYTPEEYFQGWKPAPFKLPEFNPMTLKEDTPLTNPPGAALIAKQQEVVVTVGFPASGKTYFVQNHMMKGDYVHVNRDKLGSWQKCVAACKKSLSQNHSVVVDNTSPDVESRKRYLTVAKEMRVPCRCFYFAASLQQARHNERFREMTDKSHQPINDMIMNSYKSKFTEPKISEGFTEIVKINFVPKFKDPEHKNLFFQYLMDK